MSAEYALYSGDEFVMIGTVPELAERMGVKPDTVKWYLTHTARKRREKRNTTRWILVRLEEE